MSKNTDALVTCLCKLLPLAEAYLKDAPSDPNNAVLEDARAIVKGASLYYSRPPKMTKREWKAIREAVQFRLAGERDDTDDDALRSAEDKLL